MPKVVERTGLSRSSISKRVKDGTFPKPISIGPRAIAWVEKDVDEWIDNLINRQEA